MLGHWASTQTVLSLSSPSDSLSLAYFSPCAARCRSHAGFFTSGSRPVYGPGGAQHTDFAVASPSTWHRTTAADLRRGQRLRLAGRARTKGGGGLAANELCIAACGEIGARAINPMAPSLCNEPRRAPAMGSKWKDEQVVTVWKSLNYP